MRQPHFIKPNHSTESPQLAVWFDTETRQETIDGNTVSHTLWFGWAACRRRLTGGGWSNPEWCRFEDAHTFWLWLDNHTRPKTRLWACCHNSNFDLPVLDVFNALPGEGYSLKSAVIEGPPTILTFKRDARTIVLWDTLNIWRTSLAEIGRRIGLPKLDMPPADAPAEDWDTYGKRDTEIIMEACLLWWDMLVSNDMGGFAPTLASQSMRVYRHRHMSTPIYVDAHEAALSLARACYLGGRTECFRLGPIAGPLHLYDINSMYPAVMAANKYPVQLRGHTRRATTDDLRDWCEQGCAVASVTVDAARPVYGIRQDGKLIFPTGRFTANLTTPELVYALRHGEIVRVHEAAVYDAAPIFEAFVSEMYGWRLKAAAAGDDVLAWQIKILMNSLYGKFGQRGIVYEEVDTTPDMTCGTWTEVDADTGKTIKWRQLAGLVQCQTDERESRESVPAIAAHVTAYARLLLWEMIVAAGCRNVFYCDTDSLLTNDSGRSRLAAYLHPTELGKLKHEGSYDDAEIWGAKDYRFGSKQRHKGVRSTARWTAANKVQQERWSSLRGLLRSGSLTAPTTTTYTKELSRVYTKGRVTRSGRVVPHKLEETT